MLLEGLQRHRDAASGLRPFIDLGIPCASAIHPGKVVTQPIARLLVSFTGEMGLGAFVFYLQPKKASFLAS